MSKINQFWQDAKQALAARYANWQALCAVSYIFNCDRCELEVVRSNRVSRRRSQGYGEGRQDDY